MFESTIEARFPPCSAAIAAATYVPTPGNFINSSTVEGTSPSQSPIVRARRTNSGNRHRRPSEPIVSLRCSSGASPNECALG